MEVRAGGRVSCLSATKIEKGWLLHQRNGGENTNGEKNSCDHPNNGKNRIDEGGVLTQVAKGHGVPERVGGGNSAGAWLLIGFVICWRLRTSAGGAGRPRGAFAGGTLWH